MRPEVVEGIAPLRERLARAARPLGLVPTMGALHAGHRRLMQVARRECGTVVVSVFVNPLQFDREDDLRRYPRTLEADVGACGDERVDVVFSPAAPEMYPSPPLCTVRVGRLADHLCGAYRPGHFDGVATVVLKLFEIVQPDRAYFGEKDAQQLAIVRRMVRDLNVPVEVVGVPTVREADGLAMSSRNAWLDSAERALAPSLHRALCQAAEAISRGIRDADTIKRQAAGRIPAHPAVRLEYLEVVDPEEMQPVPVVTGPVVVAAAMWIGATRLIDNVIVHPSDRRDAPPSS